MLRVACVAALALLFVGALGWAASDGGPAGSPEPLSWSPSLPAEVQSHWRELPALAASADKQMRQADVQDLGVRSRAWGDPGSGCFLLLTEIDVPNGSPRSMNDKLAGALTKAGFEISGYEAWPEESAAGQTPETNDSRRGARLTFADTALRGELRTVTRPSSPELLHLRAAACFYSQREPERSARLCRILLQDFEEQP